MAVTLSVGVHLTVLLALVFAGSRPHRQAPVGAEPIEMIVTPLPAITAAVTPDADPATAPPPPLAASVPPAAIEPAPPAMAPPLAAAASPAPDPVLSPSPAPPLVIASAAAPDLVTAPPPDLAPDLPRAEIAPPHRPARPPRPPQPRSRPVRAEVAAASGPAPEPASAATAPAQPSAPPPQAASEARVVDSSWRSAIAAWLAAHKRYPETAREAGDEGVVGVAFTVARDGRVLAVAITRSSGSASLDQSVRTMLDGQRLPPFPADMQQAQADIGVSIRYKLDR